MFENREAAGEQLVQKLKQFRGEKNALVIGIPRGGVVVAKKVSDKLKLPFDIIIVKKIGAPSNPELAIGAIGPKNTVYWDSNLCKVLGVSNYQKTNLKSQKAKERLEKEKILRGKRPFDKLRAGIKIKGKTIILVDDGIATGATVLCALKFLRKEKAKEIILAVPVISKETFNNIKKYFDKIIALSIEESFYAVGQFYQEFPQVEDEEVIKLLRAWSLEPRG